MLKRLERKVREQNSQATVLRAPAEDLPFEDASFDTVVSTLVLCGVDDQPRAVRELLRGSLARRPAHVPRACSLGRLACGEDASDRI